MNSKTKNNNDGRREFLSTASKALLGTGLAGMGIASAHAMESSRVSKADVPADYSTLKYGDKYWNRDAFARLQGDLDFGKQKFGWYKGTVMGVRPGEAVRKLVGFEGFSFARLVDRGDGVYRKLLREVGFYTDLKTGEVLEEYVNPYTNETVKVVHIANDPFNIELGPNFPKPPAYGGLNESKVPDIPFILPWQETSDGNILLQIGVNLFYPSALQPDKWPRESSGPMNQVSEMFNYVIDKDLMANPEVTTVGFSGSWSRITPWLPWMLMGQTPGHCHYDCVMGAYKDMDILSPKIREYAEKNYAKYFDAPTTWGEPSLSSLERYAIEQKPAPVKK